MKNSDFKKISKKYTAKELIYMHIRNEINLSSKQIDELIKLKN